MQITWQARDPAETAAVFERVLGIAGVAAASTFGFDLAGGSLVVAAAPAGDDRLVVDLAEPELRDFVPAASGQCALVAVGLATVDTDRFAAERGWSLRTAPSDRALGAHVAVVASHPGTLVLEPDTEGRIAASLARWGEGPAALYLALGASVEAARDAVTGRGVRATAVASGPFGPSFAVPLGPIWGPHLVVVATGAPLPDPRTIAP